MIVVADTSPLNYLVLIRQTHLPPLPRLFGQVVVPSVVFAELQAPQAPESVRDFVRAPPSWLRVEAVDEAILETVVEPHLHPGEREAIALTELLTADYLIMDEKAGRGVAMRRRLPVIGTLAVLEKADIEGLVTDFPSLLDRLEETSFHISAKLRKALLERHRERNKA